MDIRVDPLTGPEIKALLEEHIANMRANSPPESKHALDLEGLRKPEITFWTVWDGDRLAGCGALKQLDPAHGEVKSMRTAGTHLRRGVAAMMLAHIIATARQRGYKRLSLETGSMAYFKPAHLLYTRAGFVRCGPFGGYREDPNSLFFTMLLD